MTGPDLLSAMLARFGAEIGANVVFWALLALTLVFITVCSLCCFEQPKRWGRALITGMLALECAALMTLGWLP